MQALGEESMKLTAIVLAVCGVLPLAAQEPRRAVDTSPLTRQERAVLEYLKKDWEKEYRTTSIAVASEASKVKLSDASRLRLAKFIEANRMSYRAPARHRATTVALSPTEKLIARAILLLEAEGKKSVPPTEISEKMNLPTRSLREPLAFLQQFGAILPEGGGHYRVDPKYPRRPSRFIDFFSHGVEVNGRERFEVA